MLCFVFLLSGGCSQYCRCDASKDSTPLGKLLLPLILPCWHFQFCASKFVL